MRFSGGCAALSRLFYIVGEGGMADLKFGSTEESRFNSKTVVQKRFSSVLGMKLVERENGLLWKNASVVVTLKEL
jgi:hypothetical protein